MKTKFTMLIVLLMLAGNVLMAQGFKEPAKGKAIVYVLSLKKKSMSFEFFLNNKYIGVLGKDNYLLLELDAGKQLIWASSEGKYWVDADLADGGTYMIVVETTTGFWRNNPKLVPILATDTYFPLATTLIKTKAPMTTDPKKIEKMNKDMVEFIPKEISHYENDQKGKGIFPAMNADMAIPKEKLK